MREPSKDFYPDFEPPSPQFMSSILNRDWVSITLHFSQLSKMAAITKPYPDSFLALQVYFTHRLVALAQVVETTEVISNRLLV